MKFIAGMMYSLLAVLSASVWADCRVLLPEGATRYEGGCDGGLAHGQGRAYVPSRVDPNGYYMGEFVHGKLHGKVGYMFAKGLQTSTEYFYLGKLMNESEFAAAAAAAAAAQPAWEATQQSNNLAAYSQFIKDWPSAPQVSDAHAALFVPVKRTNTVAAYTQFIKDWPNALQSAEAVGQLYEFVKRTNTVSAYTQFIKEWPNAPQSAEAVAQLYEFVKRTNTVSAYTQFIKEWQNAPQAREAKEQITKHLESPIRKAEAAFKCEEARQLDRNRLAPP